MNTRTMLAVALGLFAALSAVGAHAAIDTKIYPGSMCKPATSAISYTLTASTSYSSYKNNYAGRVGVACPIVRDYWNGTAPAAAYVGVHVPTATGDVWCAIYQSNNVAGTISYGSAVTPVGVTGHRELAMSTPTTPGYNDALTVVCALDPNAKIYSYDIDEGTATN